MSERIHALAQQLFGKPSVEECSLQELEELANRYPYFAPAQFLLLQKYRLEQSPDFEQQLRKSVLYYHNPVEFEYFISSNKFFTEIPRLNETIAEDAPVETPSSDLPLVEPNEPAELPDNSAVNDTDVAVPVPEEPIASADVEISSVPDVTTLPEEKTIEEDVASTEPSLEQEPPGIPVIQESKEPVGELSFEPYHTVDYFASQGIKPVLDEAPKDKFGKQLKSFTQWLRTMKRLPAAEAGKQIDVSAENKVLDLANDSVHATEVATEAMAEVWLKQGNLEKARGIFEKLGLKEKYGDFDAFVAARR